MYPVPRTTSEKQALVDLATITSALPEVCLSSARGRCSIQYQAPPKTTNKATTEAGLRYRESTIPASILLSTAERGSHRRSRQRCGLQTLPALLRGARLQSGYVNAPRNWHIPWRYWDPLPWHWRCRDLPQPGRRCAAWRGHGRKAPRSVSD